MNVLAQACSNADSFVEIVRADSAAVLVVSSERGTFAARLDPRAMKIATAAYQHALDARALGGLAVTIELSREVTDVLALHAAAVRISADARGARIELISPAGRTLTSAPFDTAMLSRLTGEAA